MTHTQGDVNLPWQMYFIEKREPSFHQWLLRRYEKYGIISFRCGHVVEDYDLWYNRNVHQLRKGYSTSTEETH
jgi:hypothetical protein